MKRIAALICLLCLGSAVAWAVTDMSASKINSEALLESSELRSSKMVGTGVLESSELRSSKMVGYALLETAGGARSRGYIFGANDNWPRVLIKADRCEIAA